MYIFACDKKLVVEATNSNKHFQFQVHVYHMLVFFIDYHMFFFLVWQIKSHAYVKFENNKQQPIGLLERI